MMIGTFTYDEENDRYTGEVRTVMQRVRFQLQPRELDAQEMKRENASRYPYYTLWAEVEGGELVEAGAAWIDPEHTEYEQSLSIVWDDPVFAQPVWFRVRKKQDRWVAVFVRRKQNQEEARASAREAMTNAAD